MSYSPLWRRQRLLTEVSSKAFSVEELSLWTGRTSVSTEGPSVGSRQILSWEIFF